MSDRKKRATKTELKDLPPLVMTSVLKSLVSDNKSHRHRNVANLERASKQLSKHLDDGVKGFNARLYDTESVDIDMKDDASRTKGWKRLMGLRADRHIRRIRELVFDIDSVDWTELFYWLTKLNLPETVNLVLDIDFVAGTSRPFNMACFEPCLQNLVKLECWIPCDKEEEGDDDGSGPILPETFIYPFRREGDLAFPKLEELWISPTRASPVLKAIRAPKLKQLTIGSMEFDENDDIDLDHISHFKAVRRLRINAGWHLNTASIGRLTRVKDLWIRGDDSAMSVITVLSENPTLEKIHVDGAWQDTDMKRLAPFANVLKQFSAMTTIHPDNLVGIDALQKLESVSIDEPWFDGRYVVYSEKSGKALANLWKKYKNLKHMYLNMLSPEAVHALRSGDVPGKYERFNLYRKGSTHPVILPNGEYANTAEVYRLNFTAPNYYHWRPPNASSS